MAGDVNRIEAVLADVTQARNGLAGAFDRWVVELANDHPEMVGAEQLLALDVVSDLIERLRAQGLTVRVNDEGPVSVSGLTPGGLIGHRPTGDYPRPLVSTVPGNVSADPHGCFGDSPLLRHYAALRELADRRSAAERFRMMHVQDRPGAEDATVKDMLGDEAEQKARESEVKARALAVADRVLSLPAGPLDAERILHPGTLKLVGKLRVVQVNRDDIGRVREVRVEMEKPDGLLGVPASPTMYDVPKNLTLVLLDCGPDRDRDGDILDPNGCMVMTPGGTSVSFLVADAAERIDAADPALRFAPGQRLYPADWGKVKIPPELADSPEVREAMAARVDAALAEEMRKLDEAMASTSPTGEPFGIFTQVPNPLHGRGQLSQENRQRQCDEKGRAEGPDYVV